MATLPSSASLARCSIATYLPFTFCREFDLVLLLVYEHITRDHLRSWSAGVSAPILHALRTVRKQIGSGSRETDSA